jgi:hypothetical protein
MSAARDFSTAPRRRGQGRLDLLALATGILAMVAAGWGAWCASSDLGRTQAAVARARGELSATRNQASTTAPASARLDHALASRVLLSRAAPPQRVVSELASLLPARVRLESLRRGHGDRLELDLRVRARGAEEYDRFLEQLLISGQYAEVLPGDEARGDEMSASVRLVHRETGTP